MLLKRLVTKARNHGFLKFLKGISAVEYFKKRFVYSDPEWSELFEKFYRHDTQID